MWRGERCSEVVWLHEAPRRLGHVGEEDVYPGPCTLTTEALCTLTTKALLYDVHTVALCTLTNVSLCTRTTKALL